MDENDNSPSFDRHIYQGSIQENSLPGTEIALGSPLKVTDPDVNDIIKLQVSRTVIRFVGIIFACNNIITDTYGHLFHL